MSYPVSDRSLETGGLKSSELLTIAELAELYEHYPGWFSILREINISQADDMDTANYFVMPGRLCETECFVKQQLALLRQREPPWFQSGRRPPRLPPIKHQQLSAAQAMAVQGLLSHSLAVLTGGPGVGKTSLIRNMIHCLDEEYAEFLTSFTFRRRCSVSSVDARCHCHDTVL